MFQPEAEAGDDHRCWTEKEQADAWSEWYNVYRAVNWAYTASMPMIFGIGLSPLMQWLILPPVIVAMFRRLGTMLFGQHKVQSTNPTQDFTRNLP